MEALSPRDANALPKRTTDLKAKAAAQLKTSKDKDHPPPPPPHVIEPPSSDRKNGAVYQVGKLLGKGGFAICYDGKHVDTGKKHALKIVKSHMPVKMQQKVNMVSFPNNPCVAIANALTSFKPNCKFTRR